MYCTHVAISHPSSIEGVQPYQEYGPIRSTALSGVRPYQEYSPIRSMALPGVRPCQEYGLIRSTALSGVRLYQEYGPIRSTALPGVRPYQKVQSTAQTEEQQLIRAFNWLIFSIRDGTLVEYVRLLCLVHWIDFISQFITDRYVVFYVSSTVQSDRV